MRRVGWLDASSGISGDMLLAACVDAGVPLDVPQGAIDALDLPERITLVAEEALRAGLAATHVRVEAPESRHHRRLPDVLALLEPLDPPVREQAGAVFRALADAEARVHRVRPEDVHFHEVGALDSIADVVGVVAAVRSLSLDRLVCGPLALGGGRARTEHGSIPIPGPAVVELLRHHGVAGHGGPMERELATPTGVALAVVLADGFGPMPPLVPEVVGVGAGTWDPEDHANVLRLVVGTMAEAAPAPEALPVEAACVLEANVDDLDPRLWPRVLSALLEAGADDAWLTPIVMKKGRPAHVVSVLCRPDSSDVLARVLLTHTSTIGLRRRSAEKLPLPRESVEVEVLGSQVRVKVARLDGAVVNVSPEYDDVARIAEAQGLPEKVVLAEAQRAAAGLWRSP
jgi:uncharacterized protein (TIGR00299 family) protein